MTTIKEKRQQQLKKYLVFAAMFIAFAACIWWIFVPSGSGENEKQQEQGFNDELPSPDDQGLPGDKRKVYELENLKKRTNSRMLTLNDYSLFPDEEQVGIKDHAPDENDAELSEPTPAPIETSVDSYQDISRTLGSFYTETDPQEQEILALEWRIQELEKKLEEDTERQNAVNEQIALMEKSYEMASRYLPSITPQATEQVQGLRMPETERQRKWKPVAVSNIHTSAVSSLSQHDISETGERVDDRFFTVGERTDENVPNTIRACIDEDQSILSGQSVFIRLLEPVRIGSNMIPVNTQLTGQAVLQGERLNINVSSIEYHGTIYPVQLTAYGNDGNQGIHIHSMMEMDAVKEMIANMGTSMSGITITDNAGSQIAADLTRGLMQGTSQLFAKKLRMQKVNLKAGHTLLLMAELD